MTTVTKKLPSAGGSYVREGDKLKCVVDPTKHHPGKSRAHEVEAEPEAGAEAPADQAERPSSRKRGS